MILFMLGATAHLYGFPKISIVLAILMAIILVLGGIMFLVSFVSELVRRK